MSGELIEVLWQSADQSHILDLNLVDPVVSVAMHTQALRPTWVTIVLLPFEELWVLQPLLELVENCNVIWVGGTKNHCEEREKKWKDKVLVMGFHGKSVLPRHASTSDQKN